MEHRNYRVRRGDNIPNPW